MIPFINYDFAEFENIIGKLNSNPEDVDIDVGLLNELKLELNHFFKDATCLDVIYTKNIDKPFFGMVVMPYLNDAMVDKILQSDEKIMIDKYYIELDSKLFQPQNNANVEEITAILLYEVSRVINNSNPVESVRHAIDDYMVKNNTNLILSDSVHYTEIISFGIKDTIRKVCSMFECPNEDELDDEFVTACGYGDFLHNAYNHISDNGFSINTNLNNKLILLSWTLRLYADVKTRRIDAIHSLRDSISSTASSLEIREMNNVIRRLNRIDDSSLLPMAESAVGERYDKSLRSIKYKGIRSLEDDLYEYRMRIRNIEDENDALFILRAINTRLAIIDDYVHTEKMSDQEQKRWFTLYDSFDKIRDELSKKQTYRNKQFGIIVQYPDIKPNRGMGQ